MPDGWTDTWTMAKMRETLHAVACKNQWRKTINFLSCHEKNNKQCLHVMHIQNTVKC